MARKNLPKSPPTAPQKPPESLSESELLKIRADQAGKRLLEISDHLAELSTLAYENQDQSEYNSLLSGLENLLSHFSTQVSDIGKWLAETK